MNRMSGVVLAVAGACGASSVACADNLLGLYAGVGVGESTVRSDNYGSSYGYGYGYGGYDSDHHTGWKAIVGIKPLPIVGAELEYIDFGHPGSDNYYYNNNYYYGPDSHPRAIAAFAVGHIPLPLPFLDVYAKAGAARLHTNVNGFDGPNCTYSYGGPCSASGTNASQSVWDTRFAYGAGVQYRIWAISLGAEYERISSPYGDPDLLSVRATWTF